MDRDNGQLHHPDFPSTSQWDPKLTGSYLLGPNRQSREGLGALVRPLRILHPCLMDFSGKSKTATERHALPRTPAREWGQVTGLEMGRWVSGSHHGAQKSSHTWSPSHRQNFHAREPISSYLRKSLYTNTKKKSKASELGAGHRNLPKDGNENQRKTQDKHRQVLSLIQ